MGNIGEWVVMDEGWIVFEGLYQIGLYGGFQQDCYGVVCFDVVVGDCVFVVLIVDNDIVEVFLQVFQVFGQVENGYDF